MIRTIKNPERALWKEIFTRPVMEENLKDGISQILMEVRKNGDDALIKYTARFDGVYLREIAVADNEIDTAGQGVPAELKRAIHQAIENISRYHRAQLPDSISVETIPPVLDIASKLPAVTSLILDELLSLYLTLTGQ